MNNNTQKGIIFLVTAIVVFGLIFGIIVLTKNAGKNPQDISQENAASIMNKLYNKIKINNLSEIKGNVDLDSVNLADSLPDISKYPAQVDNTTPDFIEIFSSTEKATIAESGSTDKDRWLVDAANAFNSSGIKVDGKPVSVRIRGIASGVGLDYISSGKYVPDAFSPSNELWGDSLEAVGVKISLAEKKLTGNVAGIVLSKQKNNEIIGKYGSVSMQNIIKAVEANEITMGYTNPFASSTGINFLISTLYSFDSDNPFSDESIKAFESFQSNIPFVSYTTLQMKDAAKSGVLDGFVFEYQQFMNSPDLKSDYIFTPFGVRHDSPVYELGNLTEAKKETLRLFIEFCKKDEWQKKASDFGFNGHDNYVFEIDNVKGNELTRAQKLWKEKKSGNRDIIAVFVADISGSMAGEPINKLKESLITGSKFINQNSSIGLVTFSSNVNVALPIRKFDLNQRSFFTGAVNNMQANGQTAMFDAIVVASKMLMDAKDDNPDAKLMMFVLTDGENNQGNTLKDTRQMIEGLSIPIYTIGYNANISVLSEISGINEAATINADSDDVVYKLQNLFNAEM